MSGRHVEDFDHEDEREQADRAIKGLISALFATALLVVVVFAGYLLYLGLRGIYG